LLNLNPEERNDSKDAKRIPPIFDFVEKALLFVAGLAAFVVPNIIAAPAHAQATAPRSFEVATIKPTDPKSRDNPKTRFRGINTRSNTLTTHDVTIREIIQYAYNLGSDSFGADNHLVGGPDWIESARFDVEGKPEESFTPELQKLSPEQYRAAMRSMTQGLLADRCKLEVHHETRELPAYALVIAKNGPKLSPSAWHEGLPRGVWRAGSGWRGSDATIDKLSQTLGTLPEIDGRTVIDKTGLTGKYDFILKFMPDAVLAAQSQRGGPTVAPENVAPLGCGSRGTTRPKT
jgi:uncharacterized protein (TIGR03435 family)